MRHHPSGCHEHFEVWFGLSETRITVGISSSIVNGDSRDYLTFFCPSLVDSSGKQRKKEIDKLFNLGANSLILFFFFKVFLSIQSLKSAA